MNIFLQGTSSAAKLAVAAESAAYVTSGSLLIISWVGGSIDFMNNNTGFIGGLGIIGTFLMSWYYRHRDCKRKEERIDRTERTRHDDEQI